MVFIMISDPGRVLKIVIEGFLYLEDLNIQREGMQLEL